MYAVEKFHPYIAGTKFVIVTDHSALVHLQTAKTRNAKIARWAMRLAAYDFTLKHRAGRLHNNADGLSRSRAAPSPDTPPPDAVGIEDTWLEDPAAFEAAFDVFAADPHLDGDAAIPLLEPPAAPQQLGPR